MNNVFNINIKYINTHTYIIIMSLKNLRSTNLGPINYYELRDQILNLIKTKVSDPILSDKLAKNFENTYDFECYFAQDHVNNHGFGTYNSSDANFNAKLNVKNSINALSGREISCYLKGLHYHPNFKYFVLSVMIDGKPNYMITSYVDIKARMSIKAQANSWSVIAIDNLKINFEVKNN